MLYKSEEKKVWASHKPLLEGFINGYHLLKNSGWSEQYLHLMDDLVVDVAEKMWFFVSYSYKKCFIKVKFELCKSLCQKDA